jgi:DNA-binding MarR family transcriptional regulator
MATLTFGQQLAFTSRALTRRLHRTLANRDVEPATWYALITINTIGPAVPIDALREELSQAPAVASLDELASDGLIQVSDGVVDLTDEGRTLFDSLRETVQGQTAELMKPLDPADVETTRRVLHELMERAERELA